MEREEIRGLRNDLGISQEALARAIGVSFATVSRWETGKAEPNPDQEQQLEALREVLQSEDVDKRKVRRVLTVAGILGAVTAAAFTGVTLVTPLGGAIAGLVGGAARATALAHLLKKDGKPRRSRK